MNNTADAPLMCGVMAKLPESTGLLQFRFFELRGSTLHYFALTKHDKGSSQLSKGPHKGSILIWNERAEKQYRPERMSSLDYGQYSQHAFKLVATAENDTRLATSSDREFVFSCDNDRLVDKWIEHLSVRSFTFEECCSHYSSAGQPHIFQLAQSKKDRTLLAAQLTRWNPVRLSRYVAQAKRMVCDTYISGCAKVCDPLHVQAYLLKVLHSRVAHALGKKSGELATADRGGGVEPVAAAAQRHSVPAPFTDTVNLAKLDPLVEASLAVRGLASIAAGAVAVVLSADGCVNGQDFEGSTHIGLPSQTCLFGLVAERIKRLQKLAEESVRFSTRVVRLYVMVNEHAFDATVEYWDSQDFFGLDTKSVLFFKSKVAPLYGYADGKMMMKDSRSIATGKIGNGSFYNSVRDEGVLTDMRDNNVELVYVCGVDNVLALPADPVMVGLMYAQKDRQGNVTGKMSDRLVRDVVTKTVRKKSTREVNNVLCLCRHDVGGADTAKAGGAGRAGAASQAVSAAVVEHHLLLNLVDENGDPLIDSQHEMELLAEGHSLPQPKPLNTNPSSEELEAATCHALTFQRSTSLLPTKSGKITSQSVTLESALGSKMVGRLSNLSTAELDGGWQAVQKEGLAALEAQYVACALSKQEYHTLTKELLDKDFSQMGPFADASRISDSAGTPVHSDQAVKEQLSSLLNSGAMTQANFDLEMARVSSTSESLRSQSIVYGQVPIQQYMFSLSFLEKHTKKWADLVCGHSSDMYQICKVKGTPHVDPHTEQPLMADAYGLKLSLDDVLPSVALDDLVVLEVPADEQYFLFRGDNAAARDAVLSLHRKWLQRAGVKLPNALNIHPIEVSGRTSFCGENLVQYCGKTFDKSVRIFPEDFEINRLQSAWRGRSVRRGLQLIQNIAFLYRMSEANDKLLFNSGPTTFSQYRDYLSCKTVVNPDGTTQEVDILRDNVLPKLIAKQQERVLLQIFKSMDVDHNGTIDSDDVKQLKNNSSRQRKQYAARKPAAPCRIVVGKNVALQLPVSVQDRQLSCAEPVLQKPGQWLGHFFEHLGIEVEHALAFGLKVTQMDIDGVVFKTCVQSGAFEANHLRSVDDVNFRIKPGRPRRFDVDSIADDEDDIGLGALGNVTGPQIRHALYIAGVNGEEVSQSTGEHEYHITIDWSTLDQRFLGCTLDDVAPLNHLGLSIPIVKEGGPLHNAMMQHPELSAEWAAASDQLKGSLRLKSSSPLVSITDKPDRRGIENFLNYRKIATTPRLVWRTGCAKKAEGFDSGDTDDTFMFKFFGIDHRSKLLQRGILPSTLGDFEGVMLSNVNRKHPSLAPFFAYDYQHKSLPAACSFVKSVNGICLKGLTGDEAQAVFDGLVDGEEFWLTTVYNGVEGFIHRSMMFDAMELTLCLPESDIQHRLETQLKKHACASDGNISIELIVEEYVDGVDPNGVTRGPFNSRVSRPVSNPGSQSAGMSAVQSILGATAFSDASLTRSQAGNQSKLAEFLTEQSGRMVNFNVS